MHAPLWLLSDKEREIFLILVLLRESAQAPYWQANICSWNARKRQPRVRAVLKWNGDVLFLKFWQWPYTSDVRTNVILSILTILKRSHHHHLLLLLLLRLEFHSGYNPEKVWAQQQSTANKFRSSFVSSQTIAHVCPWLTIRVGFFYLQVLQRPFVKG